MERAFSRKFHRQSLAGIGSFDLEFRYLSRETGDPRYARAADDIAALTHGARASVLDGLQPRAWDVRTGAPSTHGRDGVAVDHQGRSDLGAGTDSYYEYLLKTAALFPQNVTLQRQFLAQYDRMLRALPAHVVRYQGCTEFAAAQWAASQGGASGAGAGAAHEPLFLNEHSAADSAHLGCFFPGLLALSALHFPTKYLDLPVTNANVMAAQLMQGCLCQYQDPALSAAGVGPEMISFSNPHTPGQPAGFLADDKVRLPPLVEAADLRTAADFKRGADGRWAAGEMQKVVRLTGLLNTSQTPLFTSAVATDGAHKYFLRPEAVESMFYLWRTTKEERYEEAAWKAFLAIERQCRLETGYAALADVSRAACSIAAPDGGAPLCPQLDIMPSFFIGETLKYLLLTFSDESVVDLRHFVMTTEAHPLRIKSACDTPPCQPYPLTAPYRFRWSQAALLLLPLLLYLGGAWRRRVQRRTAGRKFLDE